MGEGGDFGFETATGLPARLGSQHRGFPLRQPTIEGGGCGKATPRRCVPFKGPAARAHASVIGKIGPISPGGNGFFVFRSEGNTSELQSLIRDAYSVFCSKRNTRIS